MVSPRSGGAGSLVLTQPQHATHGAYQVLVRTDAKFIVVDLRMPAGEPGRVLSLHDTFLAAEVEAKRLAAEEIETRAAVPAGWEVLP